MTDIEAFILAGGESRRMGTDKSQLLIGEEPLIRRISRTLSSVSQSVRIVGTKTPGGTIVPDVYPGWGALGGLHAALNASNSDWAIVVACDLPFVTSQLITHLIQLRNEHEAVVPIQSDAHPQPLCALYRVDPCLSRATELIESGQRRPLDLLTRVRTRWVSFAEVEDLDQSENFFVNINTPADYYEATQRASAQQPKSTQVGHHYRP